MDELPLRQYSIYPKEWTTNLLEKWQASLRSRVDYVSSHLRISVPKSGRTYYVDMDEVFPSI